MKNISNIIENPDYILDDNKIIYIYSDDKNITKIEIFIASDYYKLEFSEIGLIKEINY